MQVSCELMINSSLKDIMRIGEFNVDTITGKVSKGSFDPQHDLG